MIFKLGFGPMSEEIITSICNYSHTEKAPLMIIASRNQIDNASGYVMTTAQLRQKLNSLLTNNILLCRDHCGPYFLDAEKTLSIDKAIEATKKTIAGDIEAGFNLIHIDTSRCDGPYKVAEELINFSFKENSNLLFEFGTEENVGVAAGVEKFKQDVQFAKNFDNMQFVVAQTGSLVYEDKQAGNFEAATVKNLVEIAEINKVQLKEHNADYLTSDEIVLRKACGVHAMNIAPQLGVIQTKLLKQISKDFDLLYLWNKFTDLVLKNNKWSKWTKSSNNELKVIVAGHYHYNSKEYIELITAINKFTNWDDLVYKEIKQTLDLYVHNT